MSRLAAVGGGKMVEWESLEDEVFRRSLRNTGRKELWPLFAFPALAGYFLSIVAAKWRITATLRAA